MNTKQTISIFALLIFQVPVALAQWDVSNYPGSNFDGPAFVFEEVATDIYQARGAGNLMVGSNSLAQILWVRKLTRLAKVAEGCTSN
jgi:hypothetical protein